ncbi:MAG: hypothetical protein K2P76_03405 [Lachnospiraceae bacterium]|nr:hypothetical protein [Lachnospiraceae bacterium]
MKEQSTGKMNGLCLLLTAPPICSCTVKKQATENKRQTASATLFRTKESKDQKTSIVEKSKSLDFPTNADYYGIPLIPT